MLRIIKIDDSPATVFVRKKDHQTYTAEIWTSTRTESYTFDKKTLPNGEDRQEAIVRIALERFTKKD